MDVGCEGESTPCHSHEHTGRVMLPDCSRTSLSMDIVTCEGSERSERGNKHDNSHHVVKVCSEVDRSAGTNVM